MELGSEGREFIRLSEQEESVTGGGQTLPLTTAAHIEKTVHLGLKRSCSTRNFLDFKGPEPVDSCLT